MLVTRLRLENLRAFRRADFEFQPGINLLVGVNGVGKSTALDALRVLLSHVLPKLSASRSKKLSFLTDDIRIDADALTAEITLDLGGVPVAYEIHNTREQNVADPEREGQVRRQTISTPDRFEWRPNLRTILKAVRPLAEQPLALYFSPRRSIPTQQNPSAQSIAGGRAAAHADALAHRELRLREFAAWRLTRERLLHETGDRVHKNPLYAMDEAVNTFFDGYSNIRAVQDDDDSSPPTLRVDKQGTTLDVRQLSDGERGALALVLDLARRLAVANPDSDDPTGEGTAVVLIDELDLHLHPRWQRDVVHRLTATFPKCQFIASTHSPQIISEVQPEALTLIVREESEIKLQRGRQAYGLATNWILENIMDAPARPLPTQTQIDAVEQAIDDDELSLARERLKKLRGMLHGGDDEVARLEATINTLEVLADETDSEEE